MRIGKRVTKVVFLFLLYRKCVISFILPGKFHLTSLTKSGCQLSAESGARLHLRVQRQHLTSSCSLRRRLGGTDGLRSQYRDRSDNSFGSPDANLSWLGKVYSICGIVARDSQSVTRLSYSPRIPSPLPAPWRTTTTSRQLWRGLGLSFSRQRVSSQPPYQYHKQVLPTDCGIHGCAVGSSRCFRRNVTCHNRLVERRVYHAVTTHAHHVLSRKPRHT
jgi:hypothetical protein